MTTMKLTKRHTKPLKLYSQIALLSSICLSGCSSNTVFDDGSYRSIGSNAPARKSSLIDKLGEETGYSAEVGNQSISSEELIKQANQERYEAPSHVVRYGHPGIIAKIVKTAQIHCREITTKIQTDEHSFWGEHSGHLRQCSYQFPEHCGAHKFAVINYADKTAFAYLEKDSPYYVIDLLEGTPAAKPGLWDKDDRIGSKVNNMGYMLESDYNTNYQVREEAPLHLGWVIQASFDDEAALGKRYHQAITDIVQCF